MRRNLIFYSALLCSVVAALAAGPTASAARPFAEEVLPPTGFRLRGTHGFSISATAFTSGLGLRAGIVLTARRGNEVVTYSAPARVTSDSIRANLGRLGRVDLRLERSGQVKTAHGRCRLGSEKYEAGTWVGLVEFDGETGYTRAQATALPAVPELLAGPSACALQSTAESFGFRLPGAELRGVSFAGGRTLRFQINKNRRRSDTLFIATLAERVKGIRIYRSLSGVAPADAFRYDRRVSTATLSPPAPFSGSGHLRRSRNSQSPIWTGNLALAFPGRTIALAGPSVHVSLRHARLRHGQSPGFITSGI